MGYKFGTSDVDNVMIGTEQVDKIYMGDVLVWSNETVALYTFDVDRQGFTGNNVNWGSGYGKEGGGLRMDGSSVNKTGVMALKKVRFWFKHDFSNYGAVTSLNIVAGNSVNVPIDSSYYNVWKQIEVELSPSSTPPFMFSISPVVGGDYGYSYIDNIEFVT